MITKNSVMKIQNQVANHKSQPVKLNPDQFQFVLLCVSGTVDHIIEILIMISTGVFLYFF